MFSTRQRWVRSRQKQIESVIAEEVHANGDLVYTTALRYLNGNEDQAKEVAQSVFIDLVRKWELLPPNTVVSGWLYQHTRFLASRLVRTEKRRIKREEEAMRRRDLNSPSEALWESIRPLIDQAIAGLNESDRDVVVLRFLRGRSLRETGEVVGISEDAARMRVNRALGRLRERLKALGVDSTPGALSASLLLASLSMAPSGFANAVLVSISAANAGAANGIALKLLTMTKTKTILASAILVVGVSVPIYLQQVLNGERARHLAELASLEKTVLGLQGDRENLEKGKGVFEERLEKLERQRGELFKLRGEVNGLRDENERLKQEASELQEESADREEGEIGNEGPVATYHGRFNADIRPGETVVAGGWPIGPDRRGYLFVSAEVLESENEGEVIIRSRIVEGSNVFSKALKLGTATGEASEETPREILDSESLFEYLESARDEGIVNLVASPAISTLSGRQASILTGQAIELDGEFHQVGTTLDVVPEIQDDGSTVRLVVVSKWSLPHTGEPEGDRRN
ncbi:sigma-70 family RNA polymerase sigma factor [bacterium]|jgi:RNA polymerase sigma factor (sigma-70 family)|nr:sigma-70 family RNA polymerase sigma factor [bacterium]